jgi:hypothetical protein
VNEFDMALGLARIWEDNNKINLKEMRFDLVK